MDHWKFYNKEKVIGKGSFGLAYLVKSTVNNRHYVIKSIELPSNSSNEVHNAILILSVDQDVVLRFARISFLFPRNLSKSLFNVLSCILINVSCICSSDMQECRNVKKGLPVPSSPLVEIGLHNLSGGWNRVKYVTDLPKIGAYIVHTLSS